MSMDGERTERAVQRIEAALRRISAAADAAPATPPSVSGLVVKHEHLRETVGGVLLELDALIERLDR